MYAHTIDLPLPFEQAIEKLKAALTAAKMGVVSEVDVQAILKAKIDHDIPPYRLIGVCAPGVAKVVVESEPDAGSLLPCGCCVYETSPGNTRIALQDPGVISKITSNAAITEAMTTAQGHLVNVIANLKA